MIRLFDIQNGNVIPTEHCYTLKSLKDIMDEYPDDYLSIYAYLFYMSYPSEDANPFFNVPEHDKEEMVLTEVKAEFSTEDELIITALNMCKKLYQTPTYRAFIGIKMALDNLADYMGNTKIESGRDGNITAIVNAAAKFKEIRETYKGIYNDLKNEQEDRARGGIGMAYDQD